MPIYYLHLDGQAQGPYTETEVQQLHTERNLPPDLQLSDEHGNRVRYSALFPTTLADAHPLLPAPAPAADFNPYQPPRANIILERYTDAPLHYPGIGRLACFGAIFLIGLTSNLLSAASGSVIVGMCVLATALWPVHSRLKNIGRNPNWCFLALVPIISLFVTIPCLVLPAGYQDHRKFDTPAKIIGVLCLLFLVFLAYIIFS